MVAISDTRILVFGGLDRQGNSLDDVVALEVTEDHNAWLTPHSVSGDVPARANHVAQTIGNSVFVFGGGSAAHNSSDDSTPVCYGDTWYLDIGKLSLRAILQFLFCEL